ncbi:MAG: response regulator [Bacteroidota bacterium]
MMKKDSPEILMLEHDDDDRYVTQTLFSENRFNAQFTFVNSSDDLLAYLHEKKTKNSYPSMILLDQMSSPLSAIEVLQEIKSDKLCRHIPVVVLGGVANKELIKECYAAGASSFIIKPDTHEETERKISDFIHYWFETVELI